MRTLAEDLLLLALDDDKGTVSGSSLHLGLGWAILTDLALQDRIDSVGKKIVPGDPSSTGDEVLDEALETVHASDKPCEAKHWVEKLGSRKGLKEQLARRMVARGTLREHEHTFLWFFDDLRFPTTDPGPEASLRDQVRDVVLDGEAPDVRTLSLLSLLNACGLTDSLFSKEERKQAKRRIEELVEAEQFGKAVGSAISDAVNAVTVASLAAVTAATAATSS